MSSQPANPSQGSQSQAYLDGKAAEYDDGVDCDRIKSSMRSGNFRDSVWGFVIYRCSGDYQSAWDRLLEELQSEIKTSLQKYNRQDVLKCHEMHVVDDKALYGATSHQVRDHFRSWVSESFDSRFVPPPELDATDTLSGDGGWKIAPTMPRYLYCLFADDICLESVWEARPHNAVVKMLCKDWEIPPELEVPNYTVPAPYHDGTTEYLEEDVGWMYMHPCDYIIRYDQLVKGDWLDTYVRPPYIYGLQSEESFMAHWRQKSTQQAGPSNGAADSGWPDRGN